jgi:hypothetical protein
LVAGAAGVSVESPRGSSSSAASGVSPACPVVGALGLAVTTAGSSSSEVVASISGHSVAAAAGRPAVAAFPASSARSSAYEKPETTKSDKAVAAMKALRIPEPLGPSGRNDPLFASKGTPPNVIITPPTQSCSPKHDSCHRPLDQPR